MKQHYITQNEVGVGHYSKNYYPFLKIASFLFSGKKTVSHFRDLANSSVF